MSQKITRGGVLSGQILTDAERVHRFARTAVSIKGNTATEWKLGVAEWVQGLLHGWGLHWRALSRSALSLKNFETELFQDFIWQHLFARSVPPAQRQAVLRANYRVCFTPWRWMHQVGITYASLLRRARYPQLATEHTDILIAQTPYPGRVSSGTTLVIHYHDAIPVLMPHTISDSAFHQASHFHALSANVRNGAYFVCVSEATRQDLIHLFPQVETRTVTIHNMVPEHYHAGAPEPKRLPGIVRRHLHGTFHPSKPQFDSRSYPLERSFRSEEEKADFYAQAFSPCTRYLLMVSTLEPRKNHARLIEAWEALRDQVDPDLKLVFVGHIGWDYKNILNACLPWAEQGSLFMLHNVPPHALRVLYQQALVTVCPSVGEGFDFSGVEAMRCGGVVAASDIPVHREVYGEAATYFDPYDTSDAVAALRALISGPNAQAKRDVLRAAGAEQSSRYLPERILPQWEKFLTGLRQ